MNAFDADEFGLVGNTLDGKYDIEALVAEGGFGVVYRGVHKGLRKAVAIKVLKTPADMEAALRGPFLAKFAMEARLIAGLDHPAIVRVLDYGASAMPRGGPAPWMVLDWLEGETLEHHLDARRGAGGRSPSEVLALLRPLFEALSEAHAQGIAHRDLKPGNLMLVRARPGQPSLRVLDFGIAKVMGEDEREGASGQTATHSRFQAFSLPYAAPEQVSGTRTGPWTDVHALGLILTEVLTDADPYAAGELTELYAAVLAPSRPTPARRGINVGAWERVIAKAVAFRPGDRFQSAGDFLAELARSVPATVVRDELSEAVTAPRTPAPPRVAVTTLRPAEVRSEVAPRRAPGSRRLAAMAVGIIALGAVAAGLTLQLRGEERAIAAQRHTEPASRNPERTGAPDEIPVAPVVASVAPSPTGDAGAPSVPTSSSSEGPSGEAVRVRRAPRQVRAASASGRPLYIPAE